MSDSGPLVRRLWLIFQHLESKDDRFIIINHPFVSPSLQANKVTTSDLQEEPSNPPVSLILPPTIETRAELNGLGKEASGVQACAPGRRVSTEERKLDPS